MVQVRYAEAQNNAPATNFTRAQVESLVDQANQFASDLYYRYVVSAGGHTADEKAQDLARAQQLQGQLTKMLQGKLPEPPVGNSSYQDNLRGASYYLLHAAVNSGIGWGTGVPRAAGGALFDFEDKVLPDSGLAPPQKIGPLY